MARQRTIKYPPKRGKFTKRQIQRAVDKVVRERLERDGKKHQDRQTQTFPLMNRHLKPPKSKVDVFWVILPTR